MRRGGLDGKERRLLREPWWWLVVKALSEVNSKDSVL